MNTIPTVRVDSSDPTSMSEKNSISTSLKLGSLFDNTLLFLGRVMYIVLRFVQLNASSYLPSFQGLGGAPKYIFTNTIVERRIPDCLDSTKLHFPVCAAFQTPQVHADLYPKFSKLKYDQLLPYFATIGIDCPADVITRYLD